MGEQAGYRLTREAEDDWWEVEALFDLCFAPGRTALSSYRLRTDVPPLSPLCTVVRDAQGVLAGASRVWPVRVGARAALLLGPIAVHPTRQGEGLGGMMILDTVALAGRRGHARLLLVGDAPYYRRFGFHRLAGVAMPPPTNPDRILGLSLAPGAWVGVGGSVTRAID